MGTWSHEGSSTTIFIICIGIRWLICGLAGMVFRMVKFAIVVVEVVVNCFFLVLFKWLFSLLGFVLFRPILSVSGGLEFYLMGDGV